jgi:YVTN family beta-propeller protein
MRTLLLSAVAVLTAAQAPVVVAKIKVAQYSQPCATAAGGRFVWVSEYGQPYLVRIDPRTNKVVGRTRIGNGSCGLGYGDGSLWVEDTNTSTISRVSVHTFKRTAAIKVGSTPYDATFAYGSAWTTTYGTGDLERIDPARNRVIARWPLQNAAGVVAAFGSVWATGLTSVIRVDPASGKVLATIPVPESAAWTAASADAVWVTTPTGLLRIDPKTNTVVARLKIAGTGDPDVLDGKVWLPIVKRNEILVIDPATNAVVSHVKVGAGPFVVTAIDGEAWVPSWKGADVWRIRP